MNGIKWGWFAAGFVATPFVALGVVAGVALVMLKSAAAKAGTTPTQIIKSGLAAAAGTPPGGTMPGCTTCKGGIT